jgi:hypothetical protein
MSNPEAAVVPLFLDTTIQVERAVGTDARRAETIRGLLAEFPQRATCEFVRLEFKRAVIQDLTCLLNYILQSDPPSFWAALSRAMRVGGRRSNRLGAILAWVGTGMGEIEAEVGSAQDQRLAQQAISYIRNAVMALWVGFQRDLLTVVDQLRCQRAKEAPRRKETGSIDDTIHERACRDKQCNNSNFFQSQRAVLVRLADQLSELQKEGMPLTDELLNALAAIRAAEVDSIRLYNYGNCLALGDVWIHLEAAAAGVKSFATFNRKESEHLCPLLNLTMRPS